DWLAPAADADEQGRAKLGRIPQRIHRRAESPNPEGVARAGALVRTDRYLRGRGVPQPPLKAAKYIHMQSVRTWVDPRAPLSILRGFRRNGIPADHNSFKGLRSCSRSSAPAGSSIRLPRTTFS